MTTVILKDFPAHLMLQNTSYALNLIRVANWPILKNQ